MQLSDFDFALPEDLIAQQPTPGGRTQSRLMKVDRQKQTLEHRHFFELPQLLRSGDLLVLNDSKVFPARLLCVKPTGGKVEVVLLRRFATEDGMEQWEAIVSGKQKTGTELRCVDETGVEQLRWRLLERQSEYTWRIQCNVTGNAFQEIIDRCGHTPIPPYISEQELPEETLRFAYQTVYAKHTGSAAAPTAGLHFTPELLDALRAAGIDQISVTLHVGLGTFLPVKTNTIAEHHMHAEWAHVSEETARTVRLAKQEGRRVIAVGTTSVRTLESFSRHGELRAGDMWTDIFITPGYEFRCVDGMITNFHLPKSTLLMLVAAFAGIERTQKAYAEAIAERYRFYSFGDAMLIL